MGTIVAYALLTPPAGWLPCDGSAIPSQYAALIQALQSNTTPNLTGRALLGTGQSPGENNDGGMANFPPSVNFLLGLAGGEFAHPLSVDEIPRHTHTIFGGNFGIHSRSFEGSSSGDDNPFECAPDNPLYGTDGTGGDQDGNTTPHINMQPFYTVNYIIYTGT